MKVSLPVAEIIKNMNGEALERFYTRTLHQRFYDPLDSDWYSLENWLQAEIYYRHRYAMIDEIEDDV